MENANNPSFILSQEMNTVPLSVRSSSSVPFRFDYADYLNHDNSVLNRFIVRIQCYITNARKILKHDVHKILCINIRRVISVNIEPLAIPLCYFTNDINILITDNLMDRWLGEHLKSALLFGRWSKRAKKESNPPTFEHDLWNQANAYDYFFSVFFYMFSMIEIFNAPTIVVTHTVYNLNSVKAYKVGMKREIERERLQVTDIVNESVLWNAFRLLL